MIDIVKASAGSGKTFTLSGKYIRLLLEGHDPHSYRHVLAVTFTNKATDEMKGRILKELYVLSTDAASSGYHDGLVPSCYPDDASLSKAASTVLYNILHDYSAFAVSTIDSFFQQALRAFSREIGQFASYQVELDRNSLLDESVDRMLDSLSDSGTDRHKLEWLTDAAMYGLEEGKGYRLDKYLRDKAKRLGGEEYRTKLEECGHANPHDRDSLRELSRICSEIVGNFSISVKEAAQAICDGMERCGISLSDLNGQGGRLNSKSLEPYLNLRPGLEVKPVSDSLRRNALDTSRWFSSAKAGYESRIDSGLMDAVRAFIDLFDKPQAVCRTANLLKDQIYCLGVADDLSREFKALLKEKNVLSLDDSNTILKGIIDGTDTPFIYEKIGTRYEKFLLDEFQDTSRIQWDNFKALLQNSIDSGYYNLVVGDVKQSIYRWRGSDWNLLDKELPAAFAGSVNIDTLDTNWRSRGNIVSFNNSFFRWAAEALDNMYGDVSRPISDIYADVVQKVALKHEEGGMVTVSFVDDDMEAQSVVASINGARSCGFGFKDIAVLVRGKKEGAAVSSALMAERIPVVTDDSLLISSSRTVRKLVSIMSSMDDPDDRISSYLAADLNIEVPSSYNSLIDLCEILLRGLRHSDPVTFDAETLYVESFVDLVQDRVSRGDSTVHQFLDYYNEHKEKVCISSPSVGDAVRIMTVHKAKGLDFPYVIVPFLESVDLYRAESRWCRPDVSGTELEDAADGIYDINLSGRSSGTLFEREYRDELLRQYVDNINLAYVAFTRASERMHVICCPSGGAKAGSFADLLKIYMENIGAGDGFVRVVPDADVTIQGDNYVLGTQGQRFPDDEMETGGLGKINLSYLSWPIGGRIGFNEDSFDYFDEEGHAGMDASNRVRGIVLHDILSSVVVPSDLDKAVDAAVRRGDIDDAEAVQVHGFLEKRIASGEARGWFPEDRSKIRNETSIVDTDGTLMRPDRVLVDGSAVVVVDYKSGGPKPSYSRQVSRYADAYRRMGYTHVEAWLWYIGDDSVEEVMNL